MDDRRIKRSGTLIAACVACLLALTPQAQAQESDAPALEAVDSLSDQVTYLEDTYVVPAVLESRFRIESRFNDAKVAYTLGEYDRAAVLFVAVIESTEVRRFDSYREALYLLGDSLFQLRSFRAGREYFRQVVELGPGSYYQMSIVKLLEIAAMIDDYEGVEDLYDRLDDLEQVSPAIHYVRGKTLFEQGRPRSSRPWFQRAARDAEYAFTARYFEGVALVAAEEYGEAREVFEELARRRASNEREAEVVELSHLALGRLAYENENYEEAIDNYLQLPRTSPFFGRALYELTWALVAQENYRAALRNLDILLISDPDPRFVPEAKTLMADMAMRLQEYEDARRWFDDIITTFTPVRQELQDFIAEHDELDEFFVSLVRDELEGLRPEYLPEMAREWIDDEELMTMSRQLVADGVMTQEDIDATYEDIDELEAAISMGSSIEAFPLLAQGYTLGIEVEARIVDLQSLLLDWELQQVRPFMGPSEQARLEEIEVELDELRAREARAPRTQEELKRRDEELQGQFRQLRGELDRVAFDIAGLEEVLEGIREYMRRESDRLSADERRQVEEIRQELRQEVRELEEDRRALARDLERTQRAFGARDESLVQHRELRQEIQELESQRAELVDSQLGHLQGREAAQAREVAQARRRLPRLKGRLDNFFAQLDELVDDRMNEIQVTLDSERTVLAGYQAELDAWNEHAEDTVAQIAMWNFLKVEQDFDRLVRRGHIGLVDVDWQQLDDATRERRDLQEQKQRTVDMLREAFPEVN